MEYADSLRNVLIRKINKAERDLVQLKLDYCRFVFGLTHRTRVRVGESWYQVRHVDVDAMRRLDSGEFEKPALTGVLVDATMKAANDTPVNLGTEWSLD